MNNKYDFYTENMYVGKCMRIINISKFGECHKMFKMNYNVRRLEIIHNYKTS